MEVRRATRAHIAGPRLAKLAALEFPIVPGFYAGLVEEAAPFVLVETESATPRAREGTSTGADSVAGQPGAEPATQPGAEPATQPGAKEVVLGYALLLAREHDGHTHTTLVELGLSPGNEDRYQDVLDAIREAAKPTAYLVRTDDCRLSATLLATGLQVETSALVMVPKERRAPAPAASGGVSGPPPAQMAATIGREPSPLPPDRPAASVAAAPAVGASSAAAPSAAAGQPDLRLVPLVPSHVARIADLLFPEGLETAEEEGARHHHGPDPRETLDEVRAMAEAGEGWVLFESGRPQAVVASLPAEGGDYELVDFVVAQGEEHGLSWAIARASEAVRATGRRPAAVIDALDTVRLRILRDAGYYTAAAYVVFYDPLAGRPSVPTVSLEELRGMIKRKEKFHLVDVMGEEHWRAGHLPGSEWIDFRDLGREARRRYKQDDTIVVYCNGFT